METNLKFNKPLSLTFIAVKVFKVIAKTYVFNLMIDKPGLIS